ncbi:class I SAM-dependent methyltransferase [Pararhodobacter zhoushanensis]|uniref:class I SAM-dependent methyltransferase n=1 Tax=Pararhodobacter zhoushanensis TaxID=2479545 RepID=UPI000F8D79F9|nr:methyltransferase [Pararhodobacter zhoushanensis]
MTISLTDPAPRALRLELAVEAGLALPSSGTIAVFHPRAGEWLDPLPRERVQIVTPHAPDHAAFVAQGYSCAQAATGPYSAALVCLPRSRSEARDLLAQAAALTDGPVIVDGQKTDGADALLRELRARVELSEVIAKGHGKIAWFPSPGDTLGDWRAVAGEVSDDTRSYQTLPGLFSADGIDAASALLAQMLPAGLKGQVADMGAGWGYLSAQLLAKAPGIAALHLIESDARALGCARLNVTDPRAQFHWADATNPLPRLPLDAVIMNPPFHQGREARPQLGVAFIQSAAKMLKPGGQLFIVANRHLPYETTLAACFRKLTEEPGNAGFKLFVAEGPVRELKAAKSRTAAPRAGHSKGRRA